MRLDFRVINVFTQHGDRLSGNPLCVFEDARPLSTAQMQALALQFNLSETSFILPALGAATATVRIFTPAMELPFAGHPILGTAHVVRDHLGAGNSLTLATQVGNVAVSAAGDIWTLEAKAASTRPFDTARDEALRSALGDVAPVAPPLWVDTGMEQLLVPLASIDAVAAARPNSGLAEFANSFGKVGVYVFSPLEQSALEVRFFFNKNAGAICEDPATGSACANLGGYAIARGAGLPFSRTLAQGGHVGRPSTLYLTVTEGARILVAGGVCELARGSVEL